MNLEVLPLNVQTLADRIQAYLKNTQEAHEFDIVELTLSEDQLSTIVDLIELSEKTRDAIRLKSWSEENRAQLEKLQKPLQAIFDSLHVTDDTSDAGMLSAFLKNKLMVIDLVQNRFTK